MMLRPPLALGCAVESKAAFAAKSKSKEQTNTMSRLQFFMWEWRRSPFDEKHDGYMSQFTDGRGIYTESWWSNPPSSIDHVDIGYLMNRHPNAVNSRHEDFIKRKFKEEMMRLRPQAIDSTESA